MRMPIQYALTYPERAASKELALDWAKLRRLDFEKVSLRRFPCLRLAREALRKAGAYPCAFNAADEVAVEAFLDRRIPFPGIAEVIDRVLERIPKIEMSSIAGVLAADSEARRMAREEVERKAARTAVA
jgi:1-deoxy-D-xylulose-5-phosphate reductoisomerase